MKSIICLLFTFLFLFDLENVEGDMYLQGKGDDHAQPYLHDRFYSGPGKQFIGDGYDWSGVGYSTSGPWISMISPRYFLSATHYHPSGGSPVIFHDGIDGAAHQYYVDYFGYQTTNKGSGCDLWLGRLNTTLRDEDHITTYPVLVLQDEKDYVGKIIYTYGVPNRVGRNVITVIGEDWVYHSTTPVLTYDYFEVGGLGEDTSYLEGGDSAGPSFIVVNNNNNNNNNNKVGMKGELAIVGVHYINEHDRTEIPKTGYRSGDAFVPLFVEQLNEHMGDERITVVTTIN